MKRLGTMLDGSIIAILAPGELLALDTAARQISGFCDEARTNGTPLEHAEESFSMPRPLDPPAFTRVTVHGPINPIKVRATVRPNGRPKSITCACGKVQAVGASGPAPTACLECRKREWRRTARAKRDPLKLAPPKATPRNCLPTPPGPEHSHGTDRIKAALARVDRMPPGERNVLAAAAEASEA